MPSWLWCASLKESVVRTSPIFKQSISIVGLCLTLTEAWWRAVLTLVYFCEGVCCTHKSYLHTIHLHCRIVSETEVWQHAVLTLVYFSEGVCCTHRSTLHTIHLCFRIASEADWSVTLCTVPVLTYICFCYHLILLAGYSCLDLCSEWYHVMYVGSCHCVDPGLFHWHSCQFYTRRSWFWAVAVCTINNSACVLVQKHFWFDQSYLFASFSMCDTVTSLHFVVSCVVDNLNSEFQWNALVCVVFVWYVLNASPLSICFSCFFPPFWL